MPIFNAGRTQAINDIAESGQKEALLRYEDAIVRALEDVENALVALDDATATGATDCRARRPRPTRRWATRNRSTTAGRSISCRCSMRSASRLVVRVSRQRQRTRSCCSTASQLYKALGGGWQVFEPVAEPAPSAARSPKS